MGNAAAPPYEAAIQEDELLKTWSYKDRRYI